MPSDLERFGNRTISQQEHNKCFKQTQLVWTYTLMWKFKLSQCLKRKLLHCRSLEFLEIKTNCEMYSSLISPLPPGHRKCTRKESLHGLLWFILFFPRGTSKEIKVTLLHLLCLLIYYQYFLVVRGTQNRAQNSPLKNKLQSDYSSTTIGSHPRVLISLLKDRGIIEAISSLQIDYQATLIRIFTQQFEF